MTTDTQVLSEERKSKCVLIQQQEGYDNKQYGWMFQYEMTMDNGDRGQYTSKKYADVPTLPFKQGDMVYYKYLDGKYPKIKEPSNEPDERGPHSIGSSQPQTGTGFPSEEETQLMIEHGGKISIERMAHKQSDSRSRCASFALAYAKDLAVARISQNNGVDVDDIIKTADDFFTWMNSK